MNDEIWNSIPFENDEELRRMKKSLKHRNRKLVLTSTAVVLMLLILVQAVLLPAMERQYWDPTVCSYLEDVPDTELTLCVYTELFGHGKMLMQPEIQKTGFASYAIDSYYLEWEALDKLTDISYSHATIEKGQWRTEASLFENMPTGTIYRDFSAVQDLVNLKQEESTQRLQSLPDYVQILASVTFSRDLSMKEFHMFTHQYTPRDARFLWAALRTGETAAPSCGILLNEYASSRYQPDIWENTDYPDLFPERYNWSQETMEQHVLSMLQFSADQVDQGTGLIPDGTDSGYYRRVLNHMVESGVKTYGCYLIATPEVLQNMLEESSVACISLEKAWIGV